MKLIGITGGVGAGKTEILQYIRKHYLCEIHLADEVAHKVKEPGQPCYQKLVQLLGEEVLLPDGTIHKAAMAAKIFADSNMLKQVNEIVHPAVMDYILERISQARQEGTVELFFIEAALLIESGYKEVVDEMWYIYASDEVRRERLKKNRGYSEEKITQIMDKQLSEEAFRNACDFVIDNSGVLADSYQQIDTYLRGYVRRSEV